MVNYRKIKKKLIKYGISVNIKEVDGIPMRKIVNGVIEEDKRKRRRYKNV